MIGGARRCICRHPIPRTMPHRSASAIKKIWINIVRCVRNFRVAQTFVASSSQDVRTLRFTENAAFVATFTSELRVAREPASVWKVGERSGRGEIDHFGRPDPLRRKMLFCCQEYAVMRSFRRLRREERTNSRASRFRRCDMGLQGSINLLAVGLSFGFVILVVLGTF